MHQQRDHHARIERRLAEPTPIAAPPLLEIQALTHQPDDKPRDVVLGNKVLHTRRQKQRLIDIPGAEMLAHSPRLNQTRRELNSDYSDGLLEAAGMRTKTGTHWLEVLPPNGQFWCRRRGFSWRKTFPSAG